MLSPHQRCFPALLFFGTVLILLRAAALAAPGRGTSPDGFSLLARAMRARFHQTYTARQETLFASGPSGTEWTRVVADVARDHRCSRMTYRCPPSVSDLIVADNGRTVSQFQPSCHLFLVRRSLPNDGESEAELALLRRNYRCQRQGQVRLDGLLCDRIAVHPRFSAGPWRVCWIDRAHRAVLRTEEYDATGRRQYVSTLTTVLFVPSLPLAWFSQCPPVGITLQKVLTADDMPYAQAWAASGGSGRAPCWLPRGWELLRCTPVVRPGGGQALRMRFSDGLKNLSVFEETLISTLPPLPIQQKMLGEQLGRYGQQAWVMEGGGVRVTVVGDATLPPEIGREMLRALLPETETRLARGLARDFGTKAARQGQSLRRQGCGYEQIAAFLLARRHSVSPQEQARVWIASALSAPKP